LEAVAPPPLSGPRHQKKYCKGKLLILNGSKEKLIVINICPPPST